MEKNPPANAGDVDTGSISGSGRSPGEGNGYLLQYSCLENPMDREAWWATVHGVTKGRTQLKQLTGGWLVWWVVRKPKSKWSSSYSQNLTRIFQIECSTCGMFTIKSLDQKKTCYLLRSQGSHPPPAVDTPHLHLPKTGSKIPIPGSRGHWSGRLDEYVIVSGKQDTERWKVKSKRLSIQFIFQHKSFGLRAR